MGDGSVVQIDMTQIRTDLFGGDGYGGDGAGGDGSSTTISLNSSNGTGGQLEFIVAEITSI